MSSDSQLLPPGSSTYDSDTVGLHVGDGTWDAGRDSFLLPNLMGLPFDAMRYNGMGNRFAGLAEYHQLILVHGIFAAITFLAVVPAAIFIARFYHRNPRLALRMHIWLQITTLFLATVVLILGWFAVGPARSLSNPHHGIGIAIYTLIMAQFLFGWLIHAREKGKVRDHIPLKLFLHQWLGRAIALLAIAQVALGLTLYGSPAVLFILYAIWVFLLLLLYFVLEYRNQTRFTIDDRASYMYSATDVTGPSARRTSGGRSGFGKLAAAGGIGAALGALGRRRSDRRRGSQDGRTEVTGAHSRRSSRPPSGSYISDEKHSEHGRRENHTWRDRLLAAGAGIGILATARKFLGNKKPDNDGYSDVSGSSYDHRRPMSSRRTDVETTNDIRRVEEGRPPASPPDRRTNDGALLPVAVASPSRHSRVRSRRSGDSITSYDSRTSYNSPRRSRHSKQENHTARNTIATLGVAGFLKHKWNQRKNAKEEQRISDMREREREQERISRMNSSRRRFTGDGAPPRRHESFTASEMSPVTGSTPALSRHNLSRPPPASSHNVRPPGVSAASLAARPPPPADVSASTLPPPPLIPAAGGYRNDSMGSGSFSSLSQERQDHHRLEETAAAAGLGLATGEALNHSRQHSSERRESVGGGNGGVGSPPVSVKVKMHQDGRHVTLRRLDRAEAAAERERRGGLRSSSVSSIGASDNRRWRRVEARERAEAAELQHQQGIGPDDPVYDTLPGPPPGPPPANISAVRPRPSTTSPLPGSLPPSHYDLADLPPPPPIPASYNSGVGVGSPVSQPYDSSVAGSRADSNRRRRRAERARAEQAAREARGNRGQVEFT